MTCDLLGCGNTGKKRPCCEAHLCNDCKIRLIDAEHDPKCPFCREKITDMPYMSYWRRFRRYCDKYKKRIWVTTQAMACETAMYVIDYVHSGSILWEAVVPSLCNKIFLTGLFCRDRTSLPVVQHHFLNGAVIYPILLAIYPNLYGTRDVMHEVLTIIPSVMIMITFMKTFRHCTRDITPLAQLEDRYEDQLEDAEDVVVGIPSS